MRAGVEEAEEKVERPMSMLGSTGLPILMAEGSEDGWKRTRRVKGAVVDDMVSRRRWKGVVKMRAREEDAVMPRRMSSICRSSMVEGVGWSMLLTGEASWSYLPHIRPNRPEKPFWKPRAIPVRLRH